MSMTRCAHKRIATCTTLPELGREIQRFLVRRWFLEFEYGDQR